MEKEQYQAYVDILKEELVPAMGCTEPVAVAYAAASARQLLGTVPDRVEAGICGNIIKNVKSVVVPNSDRMRGMKAAIALGILGGDADKQLEVIADVSEEARKKLPEYIKNTPIKIEPLESACKLDIDIKVYRGESYARVRICNYHTNIVRKEKDGEILLEKMPDAPKGENLQQKETELKVADIVEFVETVNLEDVREYLERQINYNYEIALEGMRNDYGCKIGRIYLHTFGESVMSRAVAYAAAASDARMNGCEKPVIILSGSGNQGMTASIPVIIYAQELGISRDRLLRAVLLSDLVTIHQKTEIGRLSAFCGAVCAGCGAACGVAYLLGGGYEVIKHTIVNTLAVSAGIVCDGAKSSCAGKIALAVQSGLMGYYMFVNGQEYRAGEGLVAKGVEKTIMNIGRLGSRGMAETDREILAMMTDERMC